MNQIEETELALASMFDILTDLVFLMEEHNHSFRYVFINKSALNNLKIRSNPVGKSLEEILPNGVAEFLLTKYKKAQFTREPVSFIQTLETMNGEAFIGETILTPIITKDGQCKYILAIVRDITERKQKEQERKENQKRLSSLIEHNGDAVFEFDLEGKFVSANERTTEISGFTEEELVGTAFVPLIAQECVKDTIFHFQKALNGEKEEYETCIYSNNGQTVQLFVKNVPIIIDGVLVGVYGIARDVTEEKKLKHLLIESKQRYKSLFENHSDAIFSYDMNGHFTSGNAGVEKISGYSMKELLGKSFVRMMAPEDIEKTVYHFEKAIREKETESYEVALLHKEGHRVELFVMSIPIVVNNQVVGIYGLAKDITNEKRMQEEIQEKNEELEAFWNNTVDPIFFLDTKEEIQKVNPAFEQLFGYSKEDLVRSNYLIVPPEMMDEPRQINQRIRNGENIVLHETKRKAKSGKILDILASYTPARNKKGQIVGAYAFYKDITDLRESVRKLQKSQKKYKIITENAFDVIKLINTSGIVEYVSPSNEKTLGYSPSEYVGKSYLTYIHPEDAAVLEDRFKQLKDKEKPVTCEIRVRHREGYYIWMEASTTPVREDEQVKQFVTIVRDITEKKKLRDKLAKAALYDYLSGLPNRRMFDERLQLAIEQAEYLNKKVAVLMLDGRKFKQINDNYGHDAGDAVIKEMAKRLQSSVRTTDTVARLGGDEMGIILPGLNLVSEAEDIASRIVHSFEEPFYFNGVEVEIGAGVGIAIYPDHSMDKKELVKFADDALYKAKESQQNEYRIYKLELLGIAESEYPF